MTRENKNKVHEYFEYDKMTNKSQCLVENCDIVLSGNIGTNKKNHLKAKHPDIYKEMEDNNELPSSESNNIIICCGNLGSPVFRGPP
jgi:hypothetical protein